MNFLHRQVIEDAFLHLLQIVVIFVENFVRLGDVDLFAAGRFVPRKRSHPFEIGPRDHVLGGRRGHFRQPLQLAVTFFLGFRGHAGFVNLFAELVDLLHRIVGFAEFLLDRFHLLAQQIFTLILADLFLHLIVYLRAQLQNFELLGELTDQSLQPPAHTRGLNQFLPEKCGKGRQRAGDEIRQPARIVDVHCRRLQIVGKLWRMAHYIAEEFLRISFQRFKLRIGLAENIRLRFDLGAQVWPQTDQVHDLNALQTFQKNDHIAVRHFDGFMYSGKRAHFVEVRCRWIFNSGIELRDDAQHLFFALQGIYKSQRAFPPHGQRQNSARKKDGVANRQDGKNLWHDKFLFSHNGPHVRARRELPPRNTILDAWWHERVRENTNVAITQS